jgi:hypothetical protein
MSFLNALKSDVDGSGGSTIEENTIDGINYRLHYFENIGNDTFVVGSSGEIDVLIVAGGGSGGESMGAGGGGGGTWDTTFGGDGGSGIVIIRYEI